MPQTVTVSGGEEADSIPVSELSDREFAVLVQLDPSHHGPEPGDVVVRTYTEGGRGYTFFSTHMQRSWHGGSSGEHRVRRLRPGERIIIEGG